MIRANRRPTTLPPRRAPTFVHWKSTSRSSRNAPSVTLIPHKKSAVWPSPTESRLGTRHPKDLLPAFTFCLTPPSAAPHSPAARCLSRAGPSGTCRSRRWLKRTIGEELRSTSCRRSKYGLSSNRHSSGLLHRSDPTVRAQLLGVGDDGRPQPRSDELTEESSLRERGVPRKPLPLYPQSRMPSFTFSQCQGTVQSKKRPSDRHLKALRGVFIGARERTRTSTAARAT